MSGPGLVGLLARLWTNDVETGRTRAYPDVAPLDLPLAADAAYEAALAVARAMPRWTIMSEDLAARRFHAETRTRRVKFVDDVRVWIEAAGAEGRSRIHARSTSRVGITDFGTNARRLRAYLEEIAARFAR